MKTIRYDRWTLTGNPSSLLILMVGIFGLAAAIPVAAQTVAGSSAFGESVNVSIVPLLGVTSPVTSGPMPVVNGSAPPAYNKSNTASSATASSSTTGTLLHTGVLTVHATSLMPAAVMTHSDAVTTNPALGLGQLIPLLGLNAQTIQSAATIDGTCGSSLVATGSAGLVGATTSGAAGLGAAIPTNPGPNTVLLNQLGIKIVLNEQFQTGNGTTTLGLTVNALHVYIQNSLLTGLGLLSGDIVISQSQAQVQCPAVTPNSADLSLTGGDSPDPAFPGETLTYSLTVTNQGPNPATGVVLTDSLPAGLTLTAATPGQGTCNSVNPVSCNLGTLASGQSVPVTITATINLTTSDGTLVDTANVSSGVTDPSSANNTVTMSTLIHAASTGSSADLSAAATASQTSVLVGQNVTVVFTVTNHGADPATSVVLTQEALSRVTLESVTPSQGSCTSGDHVVCNFGSLASGAHATVSMVLSGQSPETMVCQGTATSSVADPDPSNNSASVSVQVVAQQVTTPPIDPGACRIDAVPAATLLIPYFEVDLDHFNGATTLISINNASAATQLAHLTFWSDWGIPTLSFTIALTGFDVQTLNLRDVIGNGVLPNLAAGSGCSSQLVAGGALPASFMNHLQAWHTGRQSPLQGNCASPPRSDNIATGYITVDAVNRCSTLNPSDPGYFVQGGQGVASDQNSLWGSFFLVNGDENLADGDPDVHILAEPGVFRNHYSFYGTFVGGSGADDRQPLGTSYASSYLSGGAFDGGTQLLVWRDAKVANPTAQQCGQEPARMTLGGTIYDEDENSAAIVPSTQMAPWSTQKMFLGSSTFPLAHPFGWVHLDLWHSGALFGDVAQGWVTSRMSAQQRYSVGLRAIRLDSACDF
jgi:uncharacterized repeat protein (TIGR01451 family)